MIGLLHEIVRLIGGLFGQADEQAKALNTRLDATDAAIEHLRDLIEGTPEPVVTGIAVQEGKQ